MNRRFASLIDNKREIHVSVLGDSLSYGFMVPTGYAQMLMDLLADGYPSSQFRLNNQGVCGDTAQDGLGRLTAALLQPPADIALVQFGINDCFIGISASAFQATIRQIVRRYQSDCPDGIAVLVPPPPVHPIQENLMLDPFRQAMHALAEPPGMVCVPISDFWPIDGSRPDLWLDDGVHPSEAGYRLMARAVYAALTSTTSSSRDATVD